MIDSTFGDRVEAAFGRWGQLCVGIDPHAWLLSDWNLPDTADGAETFGRLVVAACAGRVGLIKPQLAFYERFGSRGYLAFERVLADAHAAGLLVIADVKRGDLGTSVAAYGEAWLTPGSPLEVDAITVNAYMGVGSLEPVFERAAAAGKGLFVLSATSNPEASAIQRARVPDGPHAGATVARAVFDDVAERNARAGERVGSARSASCSVRHSTSPISASTSRLHPSEEPPRSSLPDLVTRVRMSLIWETSLGGTLIP
ncbi:orotidine-5'-phosphate decarboxylase [Cryobacterium sp. 10C3]|uniref:orotidine-5'-phosphate decarboxylase n=1 Tax=Cryobacterium sp. 10C3 TaxID=3048577 RepID=UPI002AB3643F|nr:orotidine-5'-phosphate decarboxylase [Cryobacterium sp. 10C3]MDY7556337.1 orotidine-5'-phosphate decarboxylase [Cryobacterium sp. 10C3]